MQVQAEASSRELSPHSSHPAEFVKSCQRCSFLGSGNLKPSGKCFSNSKDHLKIR